MTSSRVFSGGLVALSLLLMTGAAWGAPGAREAAAPSVSSNAGAETDALAHAIARFEQGQKLYAERDFAGALVEFRKAYELAPSYRLLYNIGQVCLQMHDYPCAQQSRERYLADGGSDIAPARRAAVEQELLDLKQRIGHLDLQVDVAGAEVSVDDVFVGVTPLAGPIAVSAGRHRTTVAAAGHVPVTRTVEVAGQDTARVSVVLAATSGPEGPRDVTTVAAPSTEVRLRGSPMTTYSWIGYVAGGALAAGAAATGIVALNAGSDVRTRVYDDDASADADRSRAATFALTTDVLLVGAVLTLTATTVFTFVLPRSASKKVGLTVGPRGFDGGFAF